MHSLEVINSTLHTSLLAGLTNLRDLHMPVEAPRSATQGIVAIPAAIPQISGIDVVGEENKNVFAHTPNHRACPACEKARSLSVDRATSLLYLPFSQAAEQWLEQRKLYIRDSTADCYADYIERLKKHGFPPLNEIHIGHFMQYQGQHHKAYHPASVNHDLNILSMMLRACGLWAPIKEHYKPLPLPEQDPPKVMTETEEDAFFLFASKCQSWKLAYWVASLTNNTTASGKELRMLVRGSVYMKAETPYFHVPKNMKTPQRQRMIPMNERAYKIMERVLEEASKRGSTRDMHYIFPYREKRNFYDPTKPATESWLRASWKKLVDAALDANIIHFRIKPHNLRHQAITKMLDYGVPIETVRQIAGHGVDSLVTRHYHHARMDTMARALDVINPDKKRPISTGRNGEGRERA